MSGIPAFHAAHACHPDAEEFSRVLEAHLLHGRVISIPRLFLMVRPVMSGWREEMRDPLRVAHPLGSDCWHAWTVAGDLHKLREIPLEWFEGKPWVSFHRGDRLAVIPLRRFLAPGK